MKNDFTVGDEVVFIHSKDYGVVTKLFNNNKVFVEDSSSFNTLVDNTEIIKYSKDTNTVLSFGTINIIKDKINIRGVNQSSPNNNIRIIDLHIENISDHYHLMENFEIVQLQLKKCEKALDESIKSTTHKLIIVHGIGEGVLKNEVHKILRNYNLRFFISTNGGSTEVML